MDEDRRREIGLFRYALIRERPMPGCRGPSAVGWFARLLIGSMSGPMGGWCGSRAARWMSGSAGTVGAGSRRSFLRLVWLRRARRPRCSSWRSR